MTGLIPIRGNEQSGRTPAAIGEVRGYAEGRVLVTRRVRRPATALWVRATCCGGRFRLL